MFRLSGYGSFIGRRRVVSGVDVDLPAGSVMAVLGPNGAGKSTFMKGLCGLLRAEGTAQLEGHDLIAMPALQRADLVGYVAQDMAHLTVRLSVFELLLLAQNGGRRRWSVAGDSTARAEAVLDLLGLTRFADKMPGNLSGGERQMIGLALALVRRPKLLLLDEPTSALDLANQLQMLEAVQAYTHAEEIVTLAILHDMNLASRYADRVLFLAEGRPQSFGPTHETMTCCGLAAVYGVDCRILPIDEGRFTAVYPVSVLEARAAE